MPFKVIFLLFSIVYAEHGSYEGYKSYNVGPLTADNLKNIGGVLQKNNIDTLKPPSIHHPGLVLVSREMHDVFIKDLVEYEIPYKLYIEDSGKAMIKELAEIKKPTSKTFTKQYGTFPYDSYQPYFVVTAKDRAKWRRVSRKRTLGSPAMGWMNNRVKYAKYKKKVEKYISEIATNYPTVAKLVTPARTFEGRSLHYLKISTTNFEDTSKPVIFIDGTIHAREWITVPVITYTLHKLVENVTDHDLLEKFDWIIFPVVNPDGYDYSLSQQPLWRKTMSINNDNTDNCPGVDGNRNYEFFWGTVNTSPNICDDQYGGAYAFSEIETQTVRDIVLENLSRLNFYVTMHSYGSLILYPWGHSGVDSDKVEDLRDVALVMAEAIDNVAPPDAWRYAVGNAVSLLGYGASGASEDWAHSMGVPFSYTFELPGYWDGFFLDPIHIEQVACETWLGIAAGARRIDEILSQQ